MAKNKNIPQLQDRFIPEIQTPILAGEFLNEIIYINKYITSFNTTSKADKTVETGSIRDVLNYMHNFEAETKALQVLVYVNNPTHGELNNPDFKSNIFLLDVDSFSIKYPEKFLKEYGYESLDEVPEDIRKKLLKANDLRLKIFKELCEHPSVIAAGSSYSGGLWALIYIQTKDQPILWSKYNKSIGRAYKRSNESILLKDGLKINKRREKTADGLIRLKYFDVPEDTIEGNTRLECDRAMYQVFAKRYGSKIDMLGNEQFYYLAPDDKMLIPFDDWAELPDEPYQNYTVKSTGKRVDEYNLDGKDTHLMRLRKPPFRMVLDDIIPLAAGRFEIIGSERIYNHLYMYNIKHKNVYEVGKWSKPWAESVDYIHIPKPGEERFINMDYYLKIPTGFEKLSGVKDEFIKTYFKDNVVELEAGKYLSDLEINGIPFVEYILNSERILVIAPTNSGKSTSIAENLSRKKWFTSTRTSIVDKYPYDRNGNLIEDWQRYRQSDKLEDINSDFVYSTFQSLTYEDLDFIAENGYPLVIDEGHTLFDFDENVEKLTYIRDHLDINVTYITASLTPQLEAFINKTDIEFLEIERRNPNRTIEVLLQKYRSEHITSTKNLNRILRLVQNLKKQKTVIYANDKKTLQIINKLLEDNGIKSIAYFTETFDNSEIELTQEEYFKIRDDCNRIIEEFKNTDCDILLTTSKLGVGYSIHDKINNFIVFSNDAHEVNQIVARERNKGTIRLFLFLNTSYSTYNRIMVSEEANYVNPKVPDDCFDNMSVSNNHKINSFLNEVYFNNEDLAINNIFALLRRDYNIKKLKDFTGNPEEWYCPDLLSDELLVTDIQRDLIPDKYELYVQWAQNGVIPERTADKLRFEKIHKEVVQPEFNMFNSNNKVNTLTLEQFKEVFEQTFGIKDDSYHKKIKNELKLLGYQDEFPANERNDIIESISEKFDIHYIATEGYLRETYIYKDGVFERKRKSRKSKQSGNNQLAINRILFLLNERQLILNKDNVQGILDEFPDILEDSSYTMEKWKTLYRQLKRQVS